MQANILTIKNALSLLKSRKISLKEIYREVFSAISKRNGELNVFLRLDQEALAKAEFCVDQLLGGIPLAVKDNFLTVGLPTTASSKPLEGFMPPYESTVTKKLKETGAVIIGKTNMDAWAHGSSTETSQFGPTKNPRNPEYLPGGSSGGSTAAVAADMCLGAIGSETAGSIRQPAAWCGVVGLKPTYGRVSRYGVVAMASSTDSPGPIGKTVEDCALLLKVIAGKDENDATSSPQGVPDYLSSFKSGVKGMKIGVCYIDHPQIKNTPVAQAIKDAAGVFEKLGAKVEQVEISETLQPGKILKHDYAIGVYTVVQRSEVSSNLARYDGIRYGHWRDTFGDEAKRRIMLGTFTLSKGYADKYYVHSQQVRSLYIKNFKELFSRYDLLISSPSPSFALPIGATKGDPMFGELQDMLVEPSSLAGLPGISIPCFRDEKTNLYLGLNIMANQWQEEKILRAAYAFEQATNWNHWAKQTI
jgi:aspartyl-tRNA(Asn)/glutamyl-tRNA(Gln) amidotransferase subunit A